jgi:hypothetical protein
MKHAWGELRNAYIILDKSVKEGPNLVQAGEGEMIILKRVLNRI